MKRLAIALFALICLVVAKAQNDAPVTWQAQTIEDSPTSGHLIMNATVEPGYHFYAFAPQGGINSLEIEIEGSKGFSHGEITSSVPPTIEFSAAMNDTLAWWGSDVEFSIPFELNEVDGVNIKATIRYQYCDDAKCFTPKKQSFDLTFGKPGNYPLQDSQHQKAAAGSQQSDNQRWKPVVTESPTADNSPLIILILGFIGGLAALLTPCVWPMIPMTLSFFLKKGKATNKSKRDALTYGLSIVVIYLVLGIGITLIFGAGKLNELSTSAIFNIIFFLLLVVFAVSFFGAFDIKLPSKWSNAIDNKAESTTGILSIFFMAFTLALVSFSCTGPIIGTLLVEAASNGNILGPALGMGGFAIGLALPFSLFALFPSMLNEMPKSGGWLNTVKVVLGFIELILSLKFLSVADMAYGWHILDREVFVSVWIVLFTLLGLYLLGKIRFSHDSKQEHVGIPRFFLAIFSFAFSIYLLPGLWGAPLKAVSAFVPPLETQDFNLYSHENNYVEFDDYDAGMQYAADNKKPVLLDFSGWGCVNCRKMEAEVFDTEAVRKTLAENFVVIKLMVDEKASLPTPFIVTENGEDVVLETVGEKWSYLQSHKFGANSQPYYIVLNNEGEPMNKPVFYDNNVDGFISWLEEGYNNYKK